MHRIDGLTQRQIASSMGVSSSTIESDLRLVYRLLDEYLRVLVDKVAHDRFPSVPLLRRIQHLIECLPHIGHPHRPRRAGRDDPEQDTEQDVPTETASDE